MSSGRGTSSSSRALDNDRAYSFPYYKGMETIVDGAVYKSFIINENCYSLKLLVTKQNNIYFGSPFAIIAS